MKCTYAQYTNTCTHARTHTHTHTHVHSLNNIYIYIYIYICSTWKVLINIAIAVKRFVPMFVEIAKCTISLSIVTHEPWSIVIILKLPSSKSNMYVCSSCSITSLKNV